MQQPTGALYDLLQRSFLSYMFHPYPYFAQIIPFNLKILLGRKNGRVTVVYGPIRALEENLSKTTLLLHLLNWRSFTDTKDEETSWIEFFFISRIRWLSYLCYSRCWRAKEKNVDVFSQGNIAYEDNMEQFKTTEWIPLILVVMMVTLIMIGVQHPLNILMINLQCLIFIILSS